jgi:hypothetical protein
MPIALHLDNGAGFEICKVCIDDDFSLSGFIIIIILINIVIIFNININLLILNFISFKIYFRESFSPKF